MSQQIPISIINELYQTLEDLYDRDLKFEAAMILYSMLLFHCLTYEATRCFGKFRGTLL